jgi:hypothetical protein
MFCQVIEYLQYYFQIEHDSVLNTQIVTTTGYNDKIINLKHFIE